jgi:hypothetical protein
VSPAHDHAADENTAHEQPDAEAWQAQLADAFAILLGRPLEEFDPKAAYVLYHWDDVLSAELTEYVPDPEQLAGIVPPQENAEEYPLCWASWHLDLGRSLFVLDDEESLGEPVTDALRAVSRDAGQIVVTGTELSRVLTTHRASLGGTFITLLARVHSADTLFDAMRAATWTMGGPDELYTDFAGVVVEPQWERALSTVADPVLRTHLSGICLDAHSARASGAYYSGTGTCPAALRPLESLPGYTFVTGWELGEGQAASAVFALSDDA